MSDIHKVLMQYKNITITRVSDHAMENIHSENLIWVQTEHADDDEKLLIKFHYPNYCLE